MVVAGGWDCENDGMFVEKLEGIAKCLEGGWVKDVVARVCEAELR